MYDSGMINHRHDRVVPFFRFVFFGFQFFLWNYPVAANCTDHGMATIAAHLSPRVGLCRGCRRYQHARRLRRSGRHGGRSKASLLRRHTSLFAHVCPQPEPFWTSLEVPFAEIQLAFSLKCGLFRMEWNKEKRKIHQSKLGEYFVLLLRTYTNLYRVVV